MPFINALAALLGVGGFSETVTLSQTLMFLQITEGL